MMNASSPQLAPTSGRRRVGWIVLGIFFALAILAAIVLPGKMLRSMMRVPGSLTQAQLAAALPQEPVDLVVQVSAVRPDGRVRAELLRMISQSEYVRTGGSVWVARSASTKTLMGRPADIAPGAVLQVHAVATAQSAEGASVVDATEIVIITGYATVR